VSRPYRSTPHITQVRNERIVPGRGCRGTGKVGYRSAAEAQVALDRIQDRTSSGTMEDRCFATRAYRCSCGDWHLSKDGARRNATDIFPTRTIVTHR
jgi:hypothetical protein